MTMQSEYIQEFVGTKQQAQKLGAFYTPPELGKKMVDKVSQSLVGKTCLDNCCGYGNLILQMLDKKVSQGEDSTQALSEVYGNEFSLKNLEVCIRNLRIWADKNNAKWDEDMIRSHFHQGNALDDSAYDFPDKKFNLDEHVEICKSDTEITFMFIKDSKILKEVKCVLPSQEAKAKKIIDKIKQKKLKVIKTNE